MTVPEISQELAQRMADHIRDMAKRHPIKPGYAGAAVSDWEALHAIAADLPEPVDPDLIEAREIVAQCCVWFSTEDGPDMARRIRRGDWDNSNGLIPNALAAIKRGRELERSGS